MNTYLWKFKPHESGGVGRPDILIETTDREPSDPIPEVIEVLHFASAVDHALGNNDAVLHTVRTEFLDAVTG